jgi:hypothetical protein
MGAVIVVLCLSANTSFAGFPRLLRLLAEDEFLPGAFAHRGRRLVYSWGIFSLTVMAGALIAVFGGVTDRLIPLFAVGAFLAFTLSQLGMVFHWRRAKGQHSRRSLLVNAFGAGLTAIALCIIVASKLEAGAWVTLLLCAIMLGIFAAMRCHYLSVDRQVDAFGPLDIRPIRPPIVILPLHRLDRVSRKALSFALQLSPDIQAVQILTETLDEQEDLTSTWPALVEAPAVAAGLPPPRLLVIRSKYRELLQPFADHVQKVAAAESDRYVAVLVPQLIERRWYHYLLHSHRASLMKAILLLRGGPRVVIVNTPWHLDQE